MNSEPTEDSLDRVKAEIRADAALARERAPLPAREAFVRAAPDIEAGVAVPATIAALAQHSGRAFVETAYLALLRRPADHAGLEHQMRVLGSGASKIEILGDMRYSAEGRQKNVPVPGLLPRYVFAKLGRVPVLGFFVQWLVALAALPHMLRYQRASEASLSVRFDEVAAGIRASEQRDHDLRAVLEAGIEASLEEHRAVAAELRARIEAIERRIPDPDVIELRRLVLAMNHWAFKLREGIQAIDAAHTERRDLADEGIAHAVRDSRERDARRAQRLDAWASELASSAVGENAVVLDFGSGADWLRLLATRRWRVNGVESNRSLHRDFDNSGLAVALGDGLALLQRTADRSLDGVTIASSARIASDAALDELLRHIERTLKPGGILLFGTERIEANEIASVLAAVRAAGFGNVRSLEDNGAHAVWASLQ